MDSSNLRTNFDMDNRLFRIALAKLDAFILHREGLSLDERRFQTTCKSFRQYVDQLRTREDFERMAAHVRSAQDCLEFPDRANVFHPEHVRQQGESDTDCVLSIAVCAISLRNQHLSLALDAALSEALRICTLYLGVHNYPKESGAGPLALARVMQAARSRASQIVNRMPSGEGKDGKADLLRAMLPILGKVAKLANELPHEEMDFAGAVVDPLMSIASGMVKTALDSASGSLKKAFGVDHDSRGILRINNENLAVVDVPKEISSLAFKAHDRCTDQSLNYSQDPKKDVCDFKSRMQIKSLLTTMVWSTSDTVGTEILTRERVLDGVASCEVSPMEIRSQSLVNPYTSKTHTMPSILGLMYERWRGSLTYTVEVIPTKFHQGQLYVAFQPWTSDTVTAAPTLSQARNCIGATIDLSMSNRTEITIPFNSVREYLFCAEHYQAAVGPSASLGRMHIFVQNPLVCPPTVASNIDINMWISVGDDFEYIIPREVSDEVYVGAQWQGKETGSGYSEVIQEVKLMPASGLQPAGHVTTTEKQVLPACNVKAADLITVVNREYLLATGVTWTTSLPQGITILSSSIGQLFAQAPLAIRGLLDYHNYFRGDFEFTLKMNANPFLAGMLVMYYWPAKRSLPNADETALPTITQIAHAFYTPASDTTMSIRVPWSNIQRVIRTNDMTGNNLGSLLITVFNPLKTGSGGPTTLTGSIWGRIVDPYVGLKKADINVAAVIDVSDLAALQGDETPAPIETGESHRTAGVEEAATVGGVSRDSGDSGSSQSAQQTSGGGRPIPLLRQPVSGYVLTSHMNAKEMLRRPGLVLVRGIPLPAGTALESRVALIPVGVEGRGKAHKLIKSMYHAWSGTMRYTVVTSSGHTPNVALWSKIAPGSPLTAIDTTIVATDPIGSFDGLTYWRPSLEAGHTTSVPFYATYPTLYTVGSRDAPTQECFNGVLVFGFFGSDLGGTVAQSIVANVYSSIGDDFELYIPMPVPPTRHLVIQDDVVQQDEIVQQGKETWHDPPEDPPTEESVFRIFELEIEEYVSQIKHQGIWNDVKSFIVPYLTFFNRKIRERLSREVSDRLQEGIDWIMKKVFPAMTWILDFLLNLHVICASKDMAARMMAMSSIALKCTMGYHWGHKLLTQLNEAVGVRSDSQPKHEGPMDSAADFLTGLDVDYQVLTGSLAAAVVAAVLGMLGYSICSSDSKKVRDSAMWKIAESASCAGKLANGCTAVPKLWESCKVGLQTAISFITNGNAQFEDWFETNREALKVWQEQVDIAFTSNFFDNNGLFKTSNGVNHFELLQKFAKMATAVNANAPGIKNFPVSYYMTARKVLEKMASARKSADSSGLRTEPVGIFIEGAAGCGKSYLWSKVAPYLIMKEAGLVESVADAQRQTWSKPSDPNQQYMDGYFSQYWVTCDDFMAGVEDLDALQMINLISVAPCPINMAAMDEKRTVFDSKFVCATSNQQSADVIAGVRDKSAIVRRFPLAYNMSAKDAYRKGGCNARGQNGVLDLELARKHMETASRGPRADFVKAMDDIWEFKTLNLNKGQITGAVPFSTIVKRAADLFKTRTRNDNGFDEMLANLQGKETPNGISIPVEIGMVCHPRYGPDEEDDIEIIPRYSQTVEQSTARMESTIQRAAIYRIHMERAFKLQNRKQLDHYMAQAIVRSIRDDIVACGWKSWDDFLEFAGGVIPATQKDAYCYSSDGSPEKFAKFVVMLCQVPRLPDLKVKKWKGIAKMMAIAAGCAGAALFVAGIVKLINVAYNKFWVSIEEQGPQYEHGGKRQPMRVKGTKPNVMKIMGARPEGPTDNCNVTSAQKAMRRIRIVSSVKDYDMFCLAIDNKTLVLPYHFYTKYTTTPGEVVVQLEKQNSAGEMLEWQTIAFDRSNIEKLEECSYHKGPKDLIVLKLVGSVCQHARNIRSLIVNRKTKTSYSGSTLGAFWLHPDGLSSMCKAIINFKDLIDFKGDMAIAGVTEEQSQSGDCGRPYILQNKAAHKPIIGLHVLGIGFQTKRVGIADFSIESIEEAEAIIADRITLVEPVPSWAVQEIGATVKETELQWWEKTTDVVGIVESRSVPLERFQPTTTAFSRTVLQHHEWNDDYAPTQKHPVIGAEGQKIHPLYTNVQKFSSNILMPPPMKYHRMVINFMKRKMGVGSEPRLLTEFEMINGLGAMSPIVLNTGCGYFQRYFKNGKKELFVPLEQEVGESGELEAISYQFSAVASERDIPIWNDTFKGILSEQERRAQSGEAINTFWTATNKDELVTKAKVKACKTRVFVQPSLEITLLVRKYFGHFLDNYKSRAGFNLCHAIGIDKDSHWGEVLDGLEQVGGKGTTMGFDVDYANYDGSVHGFAIEAFLEVVDHYYGLIDRKVRAALVDSIVNSKIICGKEVIEKSCGNCSGSPITDVFNSITNWYNVLLVYVMSRVASGKTASLDTYDDEVRALTYGDDVIIAAKECALEFDFNRVFFKEVMSCLGMTVTAADKTAEIIPFEPIDQLSFLKSNFRRARDYVAAPLPAKVVHRELRWQKKVNDGDADILHQKVDVGLSMMAHHGKVAVDVLLRQLKEQNYPAEFDYNMWEWGIRSKQELAVWDHVIPKLKPQEIVLLQTEREVDAWNFEVNFDFDAETASESGTDEWCPTAED